MKIVHSVGGLGSQMFAYSFYLALKARSRFSGSYIFDISSYTDEKYSGNSHSGYALHRVFGHHGTCLSLSLYRYVVSSSFLSLSTKFLLKKLRIYSYRDSRPTDNFCPGLFSRSALFEYFHQCWASYKYFEGIEDQVRNAFVFPPFIEPENILIQEKIESVNSVCLHVRRGDYLSSKALGGIATLAYYKQAIAFIRAKVESPVYFLFSDDPNWLRSNICPLLGSRWQL